MLKSGRLLTVICLSLGVVNGQMLSHFMGNVGAGFSSPISDAGDRLNTGWNLKAGGGYAFNDVFGLQLDFQYNRWNLNEATLTSLSVPAGNTTVWGFSLDPIVNLNRRGRIGAYLTGGYGVFNRTVEFTQPTVSSALICDPFFGYCYEGLVPATQVLGKFTTYRGGINGGGGITFGLGGGHVKAFAEARFHHIYTRRGFEFIPVTFGIRW